MIDQGSTSHRATKQTLVVVSHAIEQAALAAAEDGPMVVFALFQRAAYLSRETETYQRLARVAAATVVGTADAAPETSADRLTHVRLDVREELAREWSLVVLTPRFGAALVAQDREEVDPAARTLEMGRLFDGWWRFRRDEALHEALRLRRALDGRLHDGTTRVLDSVLDRVRQLPAGQGETRVDAATGFLVDALVASHVRVGRLRARAESLRLQAAQAGTAQDAPDEGYLRQWAGGAGSTDAGTLPVALVGVRVAHPGSAVEAVRRRGVGREMVGVLKALHHGLRPVDRLVRLADDTFLVVMPSWSYADAVQTAQRIVTSVADVGGEYALSPVEAHTAVLVTRRRPLPVDEIRDALTWAVANGVAVATLADEEAAFRAAPSR